MENLVQNAVDIGVGGIVPSYARSLLPHNSAGRPDLQHIYLGPDPDNWAAGGGITPQIGAADLGETTVAPGERDPGKTHAVGGYVKSRLGGDRHLNLYSPECGQVIHCVVTYSGILPGDRVQAGIAGP